MPARPSFTLFPSPQSPPPRAPALRAVQVREMARPRISPRVSSWLPLLQMLPLMPCEPVEPMSVRCASGWRCRDAAAQSHRLQLLPARLHLHYRATALTPQPSVRWAVVPTAWPWARPHAADGRWMADAPPSAPGPALGARSRPPDGSHPLRCCCSACACHHAWLRARRALARRHALVSPCAASASSGPAHHARRGRRGQGRRGFAPACLQVLW